MDAFALYLVKSASWLTGFALIFFLFLKDERFFVINRFYLLSGILISFFFPLISVHYLIDLPAVTGFQTGSATINGIRKAELINFKDLRFLLTGLYISGILFVALGLLKQSRSIIRIIKKTMITSSDPVKLIRTPAYTTSFSFFSYVFVNPSISDLETREIVNHELAHIRQHHWFDLVLVELLCMLQWFNPVVWIYIRFIRQNHEYIADEVALQRTSDPAIYKATLLNQIVGSPVVSLANSFNYSLHTKRFKMMKNIKSSPYRKMKILLILPVFAIVLYAFAEPEYRYPSSGGNLVNTIPVPGTQSKEVKGMVVLQDGKPLSGAIILIKGTTIGTLADDKGYFKLLNVPDDGSLVVTYVGFKSKVIKPVFNSEMIIQMTKDTVKFLKSDISAPPPPPPPPSGSGVNKKNTGTPPPPPPPPMPADQNDRSTGTSPMTPNGINIRGAGPSPLILIDGVEGDLKTINPEMIESVSVLKDNTAITKYGEKGKNGVVEIIMKKPSTAISSKTGDDKISANAGNRKEEKDMKVIMEELPEFPGGNEAMSTWIISNLKYPGEAVRNKITGKVLVDFMVSSTGKVKNVAVSKPVSPLLDAEAIRVIGNMPDWKPGSQAGKYIDVQVVVPVEFKLQ